MEIDNHQIIKLEIDKLLKKKGITVKNRILSLIASRTLLQAEEKAFQSIENQFTIDEYTKLCKKLAVGMLSEWLNTMAELIML